MQRPHHDHLVPSQWPLCPACQGFLGWHPEACTTCRRYLEKYRPELVLRVWGYDPRRGQTWANRLDHHGHPVHPRRARRANHAGRAGRSRGSSSPRRRGHHRQP